jgi:molybdate transport system ATP-binding protein
MSIRVSIRKRFSRNFSLDVEFETREGCLGILGVSGCGKSMTLKCIAGIETPDEGRIEVNGRTLFDSAGKINLKPQVRRVGYLFQNYALFPKMTALENVAAGLKGRDARRRAMDWLGRFGLAEFAGHYPGQLSGGQQQRTALARMLIREPELILLDEPFSALDTNLREEMQALMLELLKTRQDAVMVTHSRDEVFKLCPELLVIDQGRTLGRGKTGELFASPGLVRVARLTGCKNISPAKRTGDRELYALDWGLSLRTALPVGDDITHVGIRAHDFVPVYSPEAGQNRSNATADGAVTNLIRIRPLGRSGEPFEETVLFTNAGSPADSACKLWWKYSRYLGLDGLPPWLYAPPERLLLLRE